MKTGPLCVDGFDMIRVTDDEVTVLPRNYAYWQNINAHRNMPHMLVFVGTSGGPFLYRIEKETGSVTPLGPIFPGTPLQNSTAEGWYWSAFDPYELICSDDRHLYRCNVVTSSLTTLISASNLDLATDIVLRQWHSSFDEMTHSATMLQVVPEGAWPKIASIVFGASGTYKEFLAQGVLDESQVDKSGRYLLIKENNDHRVIDLTTLEERFLSDEDGAVGHSDCGFHYAIGADNWQQLASWRFHDFTTGTSDLVYESSWDEQILHVSHCNAMLESPEKQFVLGSGTDPFLMKIYLAGPAVKVAPSMTVGTDYDALPKASLDPYGEWAFWIRRSAEGRFDAFVVKVP
jgi:hypothetical protein